MDTHASQGIASFLFILASVKNPKKLTGKNMKIKMSELKSIFAT
jgi:hypothetical protein